MKFGVLIVILLACCSVACGQNADTVNPDRPSFSNSTNIVPKGHIQLEGGAGRRRYGDTSGYDIGELLVRLGISNHVEVRVGVPSYVVSRNSGVQQSGADDLLLEGKFYVNTKDRLAYGFLANAVLPTGSRSVAEHKFQPGGAFVSDLTVSKDVSITSNVGYSWASNSGQRYNYTFAVSTINIALRSDVFLFTEFYLFHQSGVQKYGASGLDWIVKKKTAFDVSVGFGLPGNNAHGPDRYYSIGISRLF
jgi:hypothetical protein